MNIRCNDHFMVYINELLLEVPKDVYRLATGICVTISTGTLLRTNTKHVRIQIEDYPDCPSVRQSYSEIFLDTVEWKILIERHIGRRLPTDFVDNLLQLVTQFLKDRYEK